jgi:hypothetical protein
MVFEILSIKKIIKIFSLMTKRYSTSIQILLHFLLDMERKPFILKFESFLPVPKFITFELNFWIKI